MLLLRINKLLLKLAHLKLTLMKHIKIKLTNLRLRQSYQFGIIVLSIMVVLLFYVLPLESDIVEHAYSNGIYV